jgi:hypothetical protein
MADWRELFNRLESRGASEQCPSCEGTLWMPGDEEVHLPVSDGGVLKCAAFLCPNCGFVRLHAPKILDASEEDLRPLD